jgi:carboxylesterase type B
MRWLLAWVFIIHSTAHAVETLEFARVDGLSLKLDLHRPSAEKPPLIVYVHGGAFREEKGILKTVEKLNRL